MTQVAFVYSSCWGWGGLATHGWGGQIWFLTCNTHFSFIMVQQTEHKNLMAVHRYGSPQTMRCLICYMDTSKFHGKKKKKINKTALTVINQFILWASLLSTECVIIFRCPYQAGNVYVLVVTNIPVPAILRGEQLAWLVKPEVLV